MLIIAMCRQRVRTDTRAAITNEFMREAEVAKPLLSPFNSVWQLACATQKAYSRRVWRPHGVGTSACRHRAMDRAHCGRAPPAPACCFHWQAGFLPLRELHRWESVIIIIWGSGMRSKACAIWFLGLLMGIATCGTARGASSKVTGQWDFEQGDLLIRKQPDFAR